jgi:succinate dehydrogenase hydrophobic anchor subunit
MDPEKKKTVALAFESTFTTRGALRAVTALMAICMVYFAFGKALKTPVDSVCDWQLESALGSMFAINLLAVFFAFFHAILPDEVADIHARISGRSVIRALAVTACAGCVVVGQFASWRVHDNGLAFGCAVFSVLSWALFAAIYACYCGYVTTESPATKNLIFKNGSGHGSLVTMAFLSAVSFLLTGLATGSTKVFYLGPLSAAISAVVFTAVIYSFQRVVHPDDDLA